MACGGNLYGGKGRDPLWSILQDRVINVLNWETILPPAKA